MNGNVPLAQAGTDELVLPARVQEALGQLVGAAKEGLLALSVGVGLGVLAELMEEEVDEVVGPKGKHDPGRAAVRHGHAAGEVTLGGRRVAVEPIAVGNEDLVAVKPVEQVPEAIVLGAPILALDPHFRRAERDVADPVPRDE